MALAGGQIVIVMIKTRVESRVAGWYTRDAIQSGIKRRCSCQVIGPVCTRFNGREEVRGRGTSIGWFQRINLTWLSLLLACNVL